MGNGRDRRVGNPFPDVVKSNKDVSAFRIYKRISDFDSVHGSATAYFEKMTRQEGYVDAVEWYSDEGYIDINKLARNPKYANLTTDKILTDLRKKANNGNVDNDTVTKIEQLHKALNYGEVVEPMILTRGSNAKLLFGSGSGWYGRSDAEFQSMVGQVVRDTGFMSASVVPKFSGSVMYQIRVPAGKGIGSSIMGLSVFKSDEAEFLFNNGSYFLITKTEVKNGQRWVYMDYIGRG